MNAKKTDTVACIVTKDLRAAEIFNNYSIDFCFHGRRTVEDLCIEKKISIADIMEELWELDTNNSTSPDFTQMEIDRLTTYIMSTHHKYTEKKLVFIRNCLDRLIREHGTRHPALALLQKTFDDLSVRLFLHMNQEEFIVFPYIKKMVRKRNASSPIFQTVETPITNMMRDHRQEGISFKRIDDLTLHYTIPKNGDYSYKVTYSALKELEEDLRIHIHLENNILFPKAIDFEKQLKYQHN